MTLSVNLPFPDIPLPSLSFLPFIEKRKFRNRSQLSSACVQHTLPFGLYNPGTDPILLPHCTTLNHHHLESFKYGNSTNSFHRSSTSLMIYRTYMSIDPFIVFLCTFSSFPMFTSTTFFGKRSYIAMKSIHLPPEIAVTIP